MDLTDVKEDNPIGLAEYEVANKIDDDPAFAWSVNYVFKKQDRIIAKDKSNYWRTTHKYGVRLPKTESEALETDRKTGEPLWSKFLKKRINKADIL